MSEYTLEKEILKIRSNDLAINPLILNRWSPRSYLNTPVSEEELLAVLDAARWAPSCNNQQPWRFLVARKPESLQMMRACLNERNQRWANQAPVLIAVLSSPSFTNGKPNRWSCFDAGTAWGFLALEARRRGMVAHGMGGFSVEKVREAFQVPSDWGVYAVVALGYQGPAGNLPLDLQARELPTDRKPLSEIWSDGQFTFQ